MADSVPEANAVTVLTSAAPAAESEVQKIEAEVAKFATEARVEITDAEKLVLVKLENEYLKASAEVARLTKVIEDIQKKFPSHIESLAKKYLINPVTHVWDNLEAAFKKKA